MVTVIDLLAAIPSVVFGLWGILVLAPALVPVYGWIHDARRRRSRCSARIFGRAGQQRSQRS